jgi:uncharacterized protein YlxW (UPF0749 family)
MNVSPFPSPSTASPAAAPETKGGSKSRSRPSIQLSLTAICFIFGALVALQVRAIQQVNANQVLTAKSQKEAQRRADALAVKLAAGNRDLKAAQDKLHSLQTQLGQGVQLSKTQIATLNARIQELQALAGLTPVAGPGIRITLKDSPQAAATANGSAFLPGIVHDFDILQVVNELRAAGAEAIAVNGIRITGYTPIRCVGPAILINGHPVPAPFVIEAIGDAKGLKSAVEMANGVVDNLRTQGGITVEIRTPDRIELSDAGSLPALKNAKPVKS